MNQPTIAVIGNPNCGKTTLFNALTGSNQKVGNWSGVTVEKKSGQLSIGDDTWNIVDLPGTYTLDVEDSETSIDERIARDYATSGDADLIINIVDASKLERNLFLTSQLLEMEIPMLVVLNMADVAERDGIKIDESALAKLLDCPVVSVVASKQQGIEKIHTAVGELLKTRHVSTVRPEYESVLQDATQQLINKEYGRLTCWKALRCIQGDSEQIASLDTDTKAILATIKADMVETDFDVEIAEARYNFTKHIADNASRMSGFASRSLTEKIDSIVINKYLGIPVFFGVMYLMFTFAINIGGAFIDFFDLFFAAILVDGLGQVMTSLGSPQWLTTLIADGLGGGIQLVATFVPIIAFLYLFLSYIEDSGYMARAAFVMDRLMRTIGLPGKSFVPLIVGFGCNVPAVMASRTMETQKDRLLTIAMAPFMSCGARLSVYALFAAAFFAKDGQNLVFGLYVLGIVMALLTGLILKHTLFTPDLTPFVMELPTYHVPTLKGVMHKTWQRLYSFIKRAGKTIIVVFVILKMLATIGIDGSFGNDDTDKSLLSNIGKTITPIFAPIGVKEDNWPATVGVFTGIFAKEAVVGTLDALYAGFEATDEESAVAEEVSVSDKVVESLETIPANLIDVFNNLADPLGLAITDISTKEAAAEEQEVQMATFTSMTKLFGSELSAFTYLVFILLYTPCVAVMGAMLRESGARWMMFVSVWATGLAYVTSSTIYQVATFTEHPGFSTAWLAGCAVVVTVAVAIMRRHGRKVSQNSLSIPVVNIT